MIIRTWRGYAPHSKPDAYPEHFRRNVLPALRSVDGFLGARLLRSEMTEGFEFLVLTRWRSMDVIRAFAGAESARAVVEPEAVRSLTRFDDTVRHYEVIEDCDPPAETLGRQSR